MKYSSLVAWEAWAINKKGPYHSVGGGALQDEKDSNKPVASHTSANQGRSFVSASNVAKSVLTIQLVKNCFVSDYDPTVEDSCHTQLVVDGKTCQMDIIDSTGNEEQLAQRQEFMHRGEGFLCMYAVDDIKSLVDVNIFCDQLLEVKDADRAPFILVDNKADQTDGLATPELGPEVAESFTVPFVETSAKIRKGVEQAFQEMVREMRRPRNEEPKRQPDTGQNGGCRCAIQ
ncbi:GTPase NRas-like [Trichosurus vulpecula]|uniref:GTPase NRas-like n=1 Tax=Trichosurus vulpecula TaxID=9337 RepID=UPI00186AF8D3|nr:GTPase NRas-like [Trichosurus vulpecula]